MQEHAFQLSLDEVASDHASCDLLHRAAGQIKAVKQFGELVKGGVKQHWA
jgi:hypothetical protein